MFWSEVVWTQWLIISEINFDKAVCDLSTDQRQIRSRQSDLYCDLKVASKTASNEICRGNFFIVKIFFTNFAIFIESYAHVSGWSARGNCIETVPGQSFLWSDPPERSTFCSEWYELKISCALALEAVSDQSILDKSDETKIGNIVQPFVRLNQFQDPLRLVWQL